MLKLEPLAMIQMGDNVYAGGLRFNAGADQDRARLEAVDTVAEAVAGEPL
jgi:hypothetical protein